MLTDIKPQNIAYFTLRELISKDGSNSMGKNNNLLLKFCEIIEKEIVTIPDPKTVINSFFTQYGDLLNSRSAAVNLRRKNFQLFLLENIKLHADLLTLYSVLRILMPRINEAIDAIPTDDAMDIAKNSAEELLSSQGDAALEKLISNWDDFTLKTCLQMENDIAEQLLSDVSNDIETNSYLMGAKNKAHMLVATLQEYERRAGQKRKQRSGEDLHHAVITILDHIGINHDPVPQLISGVIEADLMIEKGKYKILISCKRTGRERVKQATTDIAELQRMRIKKMVWFFTHFDQSRDRVIDMGVRGNIFYLPDSSEDFKRLSTDAGTKDYVLPISGIRTSLPEIING